MTDRAARYCFRCLSGRWRLRQVSCASFYCRVAGEGEAGGRRRVWERAACSPIAAGGRDAAMSYCRQEGKDKIIFVTKEDHETPSSAELVADDPNDPYEDHGLILPNGDINWNCPCLGGMASGPCGEQFKSAFSCFHYSTEEVKGSDCVEQFRGMQECMQKYPDLYPQEDEEEEKENQGIDEERLPPTIESTSTKEEGTS
ncbi:mitochondrial intermembrane space import and assembly protein 40 [Ambystoma mexicanum]|uniref:mitochondrial intermembrane space import and assembly protein 40 n=1 Tax=Ambystoma mexicanum TaxID=8296 RepID=UPI0037E84B8C